MVCAVETRRCLYPSGVFFFFFLMQESEQEPKRESPDREPHKIIHAGTPTMRQCKRFIRNPSCAHSPQHLTGISAALWHSLLSSLPFHQNIADEVLSSINHSKAPLQSPSINQQVCRTAGPGLVVSSPYVLTPPKAFTYKHIEDGTSRILKYFGFNWWAGLLLTLVNSNTTEDSFPAGSLGWPGAQPETLGIRAPVTC